MFNTLEFPLWQWIWVHFFKVVSYLVYTWVFNQLERWFSTSRASVVEPNVNFQELIRFFWSERIVSWAEPLLTHVSISACFFNSSGKYDVQHHAGATLFHQNTSDIWAMVKFNVTKLSLDWSLDQAGAPWYRVKNPIFLEQTYMVVCKKKLTDSLHFEKGRIFYPDTCIYKRVNFSNGHTA